MIATPRMLPATLRTDLAHQLVLGRPSVSITARCLAVAELELVRRVIEERLLEE